MFNEFEMSSGRRQKTIEMSESGANRSRMESTRVITNLIHSLRNKLRNPRLSDYDRIWITLFCPFVVMVDWLRDQVNKR